METAVKALAAVTNIHAKNKPNLFTFIHFDMLMCGYNFKEKQSKSCYTSPYTTTLSYCILFTLYFHHEAEQHPRTIKKLSYSFRFFPSWKGMSSSYRRKTKNILKSNMAIIACISVYSLESVPIATKPETRLNFSKDRTTPTQFCKLWKWNLCVQHRESVMMSINRE